MATESGSGMMGAISDRRLANLRLGARLVLRWEAAWRAGWPLVTWIALFAALWLLQAPEVFGQNGLIVTWIVFVAGLVVWSWRARQAWQPVTPLMVDRRLERESGLTHRPLEMLADRPAKGTDQVLWARAQARALRQLSALRLPRPRPEIAAHDPGALRILVFLLLLAGIVSAKDDWRERLANGLMPFSGSGSTETEAAANQPSIVVIPPAYTHLPQATVSGSGWARETLTVPAGSVIRARAFGGWWRPSLLIGKTRLKLNHPAESIWTTEMKATQGETIRLARGPFTILATKMHFVVDQPPTISIKAAPQTAPRGGLQFDVLVNDDYGVTGLTVRVRPDPAAPAPPPFAADADVERAVATPPGKTVELKPVFDFTWHPWAGHAVLLDIGAKDGAGHIVFAPPLHVTLPERVFAHPTARLVAEMRKQLIEGAPPTNVADALETLLPQLDAYGGDLTTFLSLRTAASRLVWSRPEAAIASVISQLWPTALHIEDGDLSLDADALRQAQTDLQKALDDPNATPQQIAAALDRTRSAMRQYLQQLYRRTLEQMAQNGDDPSRLSPQDFERAVGADKIEAFLDQLEAKAMAGNKDAAREMLGQLQQLTESMDPATSGANLSPKIKAMLKAAQAMSQLADQQEKLLAQTLHAQSRKDPVKPEQPAQERLRHDLGEQMRQAGDALGKIPQSFQQAEQSMRSASSGLDDNDATIAATAQKNAADQLRKGAQDAQNEAHKMFQQEATAGLGPADPLGRPMGENGTANSSDLKIPDESGRREVQEILRLLRERSGDYTRPDYERDYYQRLMQQY